MGEALREIVDLVELTGGEVQQDVSGQTAQGASIEGYQVTHGRHAYQAVTSPVWEHVALRFPYDVVHDFAMIEAAIESQRDPASIPIEQLVTTAVVDDLRRRFTSEGIVDVRRGIIERLSVADAALELETDGLPDTEFSVQNNVFPYDDELTACDVRFGRARDRLSRLEGEENSESRIPILRTDSVLSPKCIFPIDNNS